MNVYCYINSLQLEEVSDDGGFVVRLYEAYRGHAKAKLTGKIPKVNHYSCFGEGGVRVRQGYLSQFACVEYHLKVKESKRSREN